MQSQSQQSSSPESSSTPSAPSQYELPESMLKPKRMQDSYVELYLPFTEDPELLEKYIATSGLIRLGKVLEDLDSLAGGSESPSRSASSLRMRHVLTLILSFPIH